MLYIVRVIEDGEVFEYEYGNQRHAMEHLEMEQHAVVSTYDMRTHEETVIITK